jgi:glyoxylase-like metal-dependent hydrolase (beta-lactamase superfamily II)
MLKVIPFCYNNDPDELLSNTYIVIDSDNSCLVVDPSKDNDNIKNYIIKNELNLKAVLLTHGHYDHFSGAKRLLDHFKVDLYVSFDDELMLDNPEWNCSTFISGPHSLKVNAKNYPQDGVLHLLNEDIEVIPVPFHTLGSVAFYLKSANIALTGDFLFAGCLGRSDLPNNAARKMDESLNTIFKLDDSVKVYPGHGPFSTIGKERSIYF